VYITKTFPTPFCIFWSSNWNVLVMYTFGKNNFLSRPSKSATELFEARTDHSSSFVKFLNFVETLRVFKFSKPTICFTTENTRHSRWFLQIYDWTCHVCIWGIFHALFIVDFWMFCTRARKRPFNLTTSTFHNVLALASSHRFFVQRHTHGYAFYPKAGYLIWNCLVCPQTLF